MDEQYVAALRNRITGQIPADCRDILMYLFRVYGKVTPDQLVAEEDAVKRLTYDTSVPIDGIFNAIEDLQELGFLSGVPYSSSQIVNLGFIILNKHRMLRSDVRKWIRKPAIDKTWVNFKLHFTQAHIELRETAASADELGFHSASNIVEQIVEQLRLEGNNTSPSPPPEPADIPLPPLPLQNKQAQPQPLTQHYQLTWLTSQPRWLAYKANLQPLPAEPPPLITLPAMEEAAVEDTAVLIGDADKDAVGEEHPEPTLAENTAIHMATTSTPVLSATHRVSTTSLRQPLLTCRVGPH